MRRKYTAIFLTRKHLQAKHTKMGEILTKVTMDDLRSIKIGTSVTFTVDHPKDINSIRNRAYNLNTQEPELKKRYTCATDFKNRKITVSANPVK